MLAYWVMIFHLISIPIIGEYAVFAFYVLSGFLMTTIMQKTYGYTSSGLQKYALNRFLRLYPMYWIVLVFSILVVLIVSEPYSIQFKDAIRLPKDIMEAIYNLTMIYPALSPGQIQPRLAPPTWALTVEIFFYICIALGISKTKKITIVWVLLSVVYFITSYLIGLSSSERYFSILAASLPFSLGAFAFYYKKDLYKYAKNLKVTHPISILTIYILHAFILSLNKYYMPFEISIYVDEIGIYSNLLLAVFSVIVLYFNGQKIFSKKFDKLIGDFSYPIYLCHWQCGLLASYLLFDTPTKGLSFDGLLVIGLATIFAVILSTILIVLVDNNISVIRSKIKNRIRLNE